MEINEVTEKEYLYIISNPYNVFGRADFNELNSRKCQKVHFLLFKKYKVRLGIIGGQANNSFNSPFSAPFGSFSFVGRNIKIEYIEGAIDLLIRWGQGKKLTSINITLPPLIYNKSYISKQINCFFRKEFQINKIDLNYHLHLLKMDDNYSSSIWYNARKNLKISFSNTLIFKKCMSDEDKELAYRIISINRKEKGFPIRMTYQEILKTSSIINIDFFLVLTPLEIPIASAIIFHVASKIVQVIYWGDLTEYSNLKTMNFLSYNIFKYYKDRDIEFVDIGPSTESSVPNYGLCDFKESIGSEITPKFSFSKSL